MFSWSKSKVLAAHLNVVKSIVLRSAHVIGQGIHLREPETEKAISPNFVLVRGMFVAADLSCRRPDIDDIVVVVANKYDGLCAAVYDNMHIRTLPTEAYSLFIYLFIIILSSVVYLDVITKY